jgi:hypothetical protein
MPSLASVVQSNIREELDQLNLAKSINLSKLQAEINYAKRKIITLQMELKNLKSAETLALQKMNVFTKLEDVEKYYTYDRYQNNEPLSGVKPLQNYGLPDPDPRVSFTRNQLKRGFESSEAERNRIGEEILKVSQQIQYQRWKLDDAQKALSNLGSNVQIFINKDAIAKRTYSEIYMLYEIHIKYKNLSLNESGERGYNSDGQMIFQLQELSQRFTAYAERNPYVTGGQIKLDYDDPGKDSNGLILRSFMDRVRLVMKSPDSTLLDDRLQKYSAQMTSNINDAWKSQELARQMDSGRVPEPPKQLNKNTETPAKTVSFVNKSVDWAKGAAQIYMTFDYTSIGSAVMNWFSRQVTGLYNGVPYCKDPTIPDSEQQKNALDQTQATAEQQGAQLMANQFSKTIILVSPEDVATEVFRLIGYVDDAVADESGMNVRGDYSLIIGKSIYTGGTLYQARILRNAQRVIEYLDQQLSYGNIYGEQTINGRSMSMYDYYIERLIRAIAMSKIDIRTEPLGI